MGAQIGIPVVITDFGAVEIDAATEARIAAEREDMLRLRKQNPSVVDRLRELINPGAIESELPLTPTEKHILAKSREMWESGGVLKGYREVER